MSGVRAALFDAAGTLIELVRPVGEVYAEAALRQGVALPAWRLEDAFRRVLESAAPRVFPGLGAEEAAHAERGWWRDVVRATFRATDQQAQLDDFEACFEELWRRFGDATAWRARPGALDALHRLRGAGLGTGVVSNFDQRLPALLEALGLRGELDLVVLPATLGAAKPDPRIFAHALATLGVQPDEAVYVGDDAAHDLAGARGAGLAAIDVASLATLADLPARLLGHEPESAA